LFLPAALIGYFLCDLLPILWLALASPVFYSVSISAIYALIGGLQLHYRVAIDTSAARGLFDMFDRLMHAAQSRRIMRLSTHFQSLESLARNIFENILRPGMPCEFGTI